MLRPYEDDPLKAYGLPSDAVAVTTNAPPGWLVKVIPLALTVVPAMTSADDTLKA